MVYQSGNSRYKYIFKGFLILLADYIDFFSNPNKIITYLTVVVVFIVLSFIGMIFNYWMSRNIFFMISNRLFFIGCQTCVPIGAFSLLPNLGVSSHFLIHPNEWNPTVSRREGSNHHSFVMLSLDSNHLLPELKVSTLTIHLLNLLPELIRCCD